MNKIRLGNRLKLYLTLRCTARCPYCNNVCPDKANFASIKEAGIEEYQKFFELVEADQIIVGGGEPTLHKDFIEIIKLSSTIYKDTIIYSNGKKYSVDKIVQLENEKLHICLSYHQTETSKEEFLEGYERLKEKGFKFYWTSAVKDKYRLAELYENTKWLKEHNLNIWIVPNWYDEPLVKCVEGKRYTVRCYMPDEPAVAPDLRVYICRSRMFAQDRKYSWDMLKNEKLPESAICDKAGWCSMCDRENKKEEL